MVSRRLDRKTCPALKVKSLSLSALECLCSLGYWLSCLASLLLSLDRNKQPGQMESQESDPSC